MGCNGNCANCPNRASCETREPRKLADALAQVIVDNRLAMLALEVFETGDYTKEDALFLAREKMNQLDR